MAVALAPHRIAVGTVAPGFVETEMARGVLDGPGGDAVRNQSPYGRVARPEEVAAAVLWLASPEARFSTGTIIDVNGASYLRSLRAVHCNKATSLESLARLADRSEREFRALVEPLRELVLGRGAGARPTRERVLLPGRLVTISSYTGRMSPETMRMSTVGIGGRSRWEKTQQGRSA